MTPVKIISHLSTLKKRNLALEYLYDSESKVDKKVIAAVTDIICNPDSIENTNSFASLLADLGEEEFIEPLIEAISKATPGVTKWLADYLYALVDLLSELDDYYPAEDNFVHLIGGWLLGTQGGEISWKSGDVLSGIENQACKPYFLKGAADTSLFHQTRIACLRGIINQYRQEAPDLLAQLVADSDDYVREASLDAQAFITQQ